MWENGYRTFGPGGIWRNATGLRSQKPPRAPANISAFLSAAAEQQLKILSQDTAHGVHDSPITVLGLGRSD